MSGENQQLILNSNVIYDLVRALPNPELQADKTANDSDKEITVGSNEIWEILWIWVELATTATVGNRQITLEFRDDSDDVILQIKALNTQPEDGSEEYLFSPNGQEAKETTAGKHFIPIPPKVLLPAGYDVHIYDSAAIDAAADDMVIQMMVNRFDV